MVSTFLSKLDGLIKFAFNNRQVGTTTLLQKISEENDVIVVVVRSEEKTNFKGEVFTLLELVNYPQGATPKPYILDNSAIRYITEESAKLINARTESLEEHRKTLASIKKQIEILEKEFGETNKPLGTPYGYLRHWGCNIY